MQRKNTFYQSRIRLNTDKYHVEVYLRHMTLYLYSGHGTMRLAVLEATAAIEPKESNTPCLSNIPLSGIPIISHVFLNRVALGSLGHNQSGPKVITTLNLNLPYISAQERSLKPLLKEPLKGVLGNRKRNVPLAFLGARMSAFCAAGFSHACLAPCFSPALTSALLLSPEGSCKPLESEEGSQGNPTRPVRDY